MNKLRCMAPELINLHGRRWLEQLLSDLNMALEDGKYHHAAEVELLRLRRFCDRVCDDTDHKAGFVSSMEKLCANAELRGNYTGHLYTKMNDGTWMSHVTRECFYSRDLYDMEPGGFS